MHVEADYKLALRYPDEFTCAARVEKVGNSSVTYGFEIRNLAGELAIGGRIVAVATDPAGGKLAASRELSRRARASGWRAQRSSGMSSIAIAETTKQTAATRNV